MIDIVRAIQVCAAIVGLLMYLLTGYLWQFVPIALAVGCGELVVRTLRSK